MRGFSDPDALILKVYQEVDNYGCNVLEYFKRSQDAPTGSPSYQNGLRTYSEGQFFGNVP